MTRRPLLAASAATAALALCVTSGSAAAASSTTQAVGRASSSLSLLDLAVGGHELTLGTLELLSDTVASPRISSVRVTPVIADGTSYGAQTVNQSSSPQSVPAVSVPGALAPFAELTSPVVDVSATSTPSNRAGASSLGSVELLGMPIDVQGALEAATSVTTAKGASGLKTVTLEDLELPSIADVLASLGLDLSKLPVGTLDDLVGTLELVTSAIATAEGVVDDAQDAFDAAKATFDTKADALDDAQDAVDAAQTQLTAATTALDAILGPLSVTIAQFEALSGAQQQALDPTDSLGLLAAYGDYTDAVAAADAADAAFDLADQAVDAAQLVLNNVTADLTAALTTLKNLLIPVLDATPLLSLDSLEVTTRAVASSASKGGQQAEVVGGVVKGLHVMGVDVLDAAIGNSTLDLDGAITSALAEVNGVIDEVAGAVSDVLSNVPSLPALEVPAPVIGLLTKSATTSISGGFGRAATVVHGLSVTLPAITLPTSLAVPGAASLPGLAGVTQVTGLLSSAPLSMDLLTLRDQAAFRPAPTGSSSGNPGTSGGTPTANTGLPAGAAAMSLLLTAAALVMRRRLVAVR